MKKLIYLLSLILLLGTVTVPLQSCSRKSGCPSLEKPKTNRKGELSGKRGKSNLFPKKMQKKKRRKRRG